MPWRRRLLEAAGLAAAVLLAYAPSRGGPPGFDDNRFVLLNPRLDQPWRLLRYAWDPGDPTARGAAYPDYPYRPVGEASFVLVRLLAGDGLQAQRDANVLIHAAFALLALALIRRLSAETGWAGPDLGLPGALWLALHPLAVQAVAYPTQRFVALEALLASAALWGYLRARRGSRGGFALALACALLAAGTKESAVTLPLILGAVEWALRRPQEAPGVILRRWLPFVLVCALVPLQVARVAAGPGWEQVSPAQGLGRLSYVLVQSEALWRLLAQHALPFRLHFFIAPPAAGAVSLAALTALGLLALWTLGRGRPPLVRLGVCLLLLPQALELVAFPRIFHHRCYPGLLGGGLLFALLAGGRSWRRPILAAVLSLLALGTAGENRAWADTRRNYARELRHNPGAWKTRSMIAWLRIEEGDPAGAARGFQRVIDIQDADEWVHVGLGRALGALGRPDEALATLDKGLRRLPYSASCLVEAARIAWDAGRREEALRYAQRARGLSHRDLGVSLARLLFSWGRSGEAGEILTRGARAAPDSPEVWDLLGLALSREGRWAEAEIAVRRALSLRPQMPEAHNNLASILAFHGALEEAEWEVRHALHLRPDYAMAWTNLALILEATGRKGEAGVARARAAACPPDPRLDRPPEIPSLR